ncbi:MAG: LamG protein [Streptosporangiaceae bacterium]|nr:LamG protein [Streptosporangiaceae bacterium]
MTAALVLHWPLDELTPGGIAADSSGNHLDGVAEGAPGNPPDERLGSCLALDGVSDALTLSAGTAPVLRAYTVEAWINVTQPKKAGVIVGTPAGLSLSVDTQGTVRHIVPTTGTTDSVTRPGTLGWNAWHHVAITTDGQAASTYLDGTQVAETVLTAELPASPAALVAGRDPLGGRSRLNGLIAHIRLYDGALTAAEIRRDIATDEAALAAFVRTHPLDFDLSNAGGQHVLYIDDAPAGQPMILRITNASRQILELRGAEGPVSQQSHHLALCFRAATLAASAQPVLTAAGWSMARSGDGTVFYLLAPADTTISPGGWVDLPLTGMNADGAGGTRGTRVELAYRRIGYAGEPGELTGTRLQFLDVVNHRGRPGIPLDVGFTGGDRVLSDGITPSRLGIRLTNVSRDAGLALSGSESADTASAFVLSFDLQLARETRDWALIEAATAEGADLSLDLPAAALDGWSMVKENLGQRLQWTLTPRTDQALPPGGSLGLLLVGVHALASPGPAPIVVAYRNVPGYQDGFVSLTAQRTPLLYTSADVGIGTATPLARLHIADTGTGAAVVDRKSGAGLGTLALGPAERPSLRLGFQRDHAWVQADDRTLALNPLGGNVGVGTTTPQGRLQIIDTESDAGGTTLILGPTDRSHLRLGYHRDYGWVQSQPGRALALNPAGGNVGVGTTTAPGRLTVGAASDHLQLRRESSAPGGGNVVFLELFQSDTGNDVLIYPSIRFHHSNKFWHRIEGRPEGFYLKTGMLDSDSLVDLHAGRAVLTEVTIGDTTIGETELRLLKKLALGQLQFRLYNVEQNEYIYAPDLAYDNDRRYVFTARPKLPDGTGQIFHRSTWRITAPS